MADCVHHQLVKHFSRKLFLPNVSVFGVQDRTYCSPLSQDVVQDEVWGLVGVAG